MKKILYAFGNQPYCDALKAACDPFKIQVVYISDERIEKPNYAKSPQEMFQEFEAVYDGQSVVNFINLARGSVVRGVENIASTWDLIKEAYPHLAAASFIGPTHEAARIFTHKNCMAKLFHRLELDTPQTILVPDIADDIFFEQLADNRFPFPAVIKAPELSGGRGMALVGSITELTVAFHQMRHESHQDLVLSEFIEGVEVSFAVLRLGDDFLHFPGCYKEPTSFDLKHPDNKVKMTGGFKKFSAIYSTIENFMKQTGMQGLLYLEAILKKNVRGEYDVKFLEGAARISGNSPIEFASLRDFNFYSTVANWLDSGVMTSEKEERLCIQYASYKHHGPEDLAKLQQLPWVVEAKYEDMSRLPFAKNKQSRIRISFIGEDFAEAKKRAKLLAQIMDNAEYAKHIEDVFQLYHAQHEKLIELT